MIASLSDDLDRDDRREDIAGDIPAAPNFAVLPMELSKASGDRALLLAGPSNPKSKKDEEEEEEEAGAGVDAPINPANKSPLLGAEVVEAGAGAGVPPSKSNKSADDEEGDEEGAATGAGAVVVTGMLSPKRSKRLLEGAGVGAGAAATAGAGVLWEPAAVSMK